MAKRKKRRKRVPLERMTPEELATHRELEYLRAAAGPGLAKYRRRNLKAGNIRKSQEWLAERGAKLEETRGDDGAQ